MKPEVISRLEEIENVHMGNSTHVTAAERITWNSKETTAGAQSKVNAVQANVDILEETVGAHQAEDATDAHLGKNIGLEDTAGNFTSEEVEGALAELAARPQKDVDNGRYQAQFGFDGTEIHVNTVVDSQGKVTIPNSQLISQDLYPSSDTASSAQAVGARLLAGFFSSLTLSVSAIQIYIPIVNTPSGLCTLGLYDETTSTLVGTVSITPTSAVWNTFTFSSPVSIVNTHVYQIRINYDSGNLNVGRTSSDVLANTYEIISSTTWGIITNYTANDLAMRITTNMNYVTGTVTKTITHSDLKKHGNLKWTQATPVNTSVVCDVIDVVDGTNVANSQVTDNTYQTGFYGSNYCAGKFTVLAKTSKVKAKVKIYKNGTLPNDAEVHIYSDSSGVPSASIGSGTISKATITTTPTIFEVPITLLTPLVAGQVYYVVLKTVGGDGSNYYLWRVQNNLSPNGNSLRYNGSSWSADTQLSTWFNIDAVATLLKSNVTSIADLSDIDPTVYPSIQERWTLSRNSVSDASPTVSEPSVTWEGGSEVIQPTKIMSADYVNSSTVQNQYYTAVDVTNGKGKITRISANLPGGNNHSSSISVRVTIDGSVFNLQNSALTTNPSRGISARSATSTSYDGTAFIDWVGDVYFKNSFKVEVVNKTTSATVNIAVDYALV